MRQPRLTASCIPRVTSVQGRTGPGLGQPMLELKRIEVKSGIFGYVEARPPHPCSPLELKETP